MNTSERSDTDDVLKGPGGPSRRVRRVQAGSLAQQAEVRPRQTARCTNQTQDVPRWRPACACWCSRREDTQNSGKRRTAAFNAMLPGWRCANKCIASKACRRCFMTTPQGTRVQNAAVAPPGEWSRVRRHLRRGASEPLSRTRYTFRLSTQSLHKLWCSVCA